MFINHLGQFEELSFNSGFPRFGYKLLEIYLR